MFVALGQQVKNNRDPQGRQTKPLLSKEFRCLELHLSGISPKVATGDIVRDYAFVRMPVREKLERILQTSSMLTNFRNECIQRYEIRFALALHLGG